MPEVKRLTLNLDALKPELEAQVEKTMEVAIQAFAMDPSYDPEDFILVEILYKDKDGKEAPLNPIRIRHCEVHGQLRQLAIKVSRT